MSLMDLMNTRLADLEAPKPVPMGHYLAVVSGPGKIKEFGADKKEALEYEITLLQADEDVDPDILREFGKPIAGIKMLHRVFIADQDGLWRARQNFFSKLGIPESVTLAEANVLAAQKHVKVKITQQAYTPQGGEPQLVANIAGFVSVE